MSDEENEAGVGAEPQIEAAAAGEEHPPEVGAMAAGGSYPFTWTMIYIDPPFYERSLAPGFRSVPIATGNYPVHYRIANGQVGGAIATGNSNGTLPIRIQPPISGSGRLTFVTQYTLLAENRNSGVVEVACGLGVANPSESDKPIQPYLGVSHDQDPYSDRLVYLPIPARATVQMTGFRYDIVDNAFNKVSTWPNWTIVPSVNKLYPAVTICMRIKGAGNLIVKGVYTHGYAC